ncbi:MAG TPA: N-acetyltransferase [Planctomycetaceae bacterium]|nr:N-acetyltransferase [Planctomycetaceae bacterium]
MPRLQTGAAELLQIRPENADDHAAIGEVNRLAFGREAEARLVDELRSDGHVRLSLVAEENGRVIGHILFSELLIRTATGEIQSLSLAPMAVVPDRQHRGIGTALVEAGLRQCRELGHRIVVVLGHPEYYPRFGFSAELAVPLLCGYSGPALMALELVPGALHNVRGELLYPPPFASV